MPAARTPSWWPPTSRGRSLPSATTTTTDATIVAKTSYIRPTAGAPGGRLAPHLRARSSRPRAHRFVSRRVAGARPDARPDARDVRRPERARAQVGVDHAGGGRWSGAGARGCAAPGPRRKPVRRGGRGGGESPGGGGGGARGGGRLLRAPGGCGRAALVGRRCRRPDRGGTRGGRVRRAGARWRRVRRNPGHERGVARGAHACATGDRSSDRHRAAHRGDGNGEGTARARDP